MISYFIIYDKDSITQFLPRTVLCTAAISSAIAVRAEVILVEMEVRDVFSAAVHVTVVVEIDVARVKIFLEPLF